ncbi:hypothetical protein K488DRAFT_75698 [Vararia minispora EC-137]|uniref:Uncharacterized protein n=1 Tax=Vararia minispora EC-137 TaxID=1314806 RepID=A0ACB8QYD4_9AGAM|nr:hypothetical protein K488DRAFT_75698 [Vararia minispora EC-137]
MVPPQATIGSNLPFGQWLFAFALVASLFFTWGFSYGIRKLVDVLNARFQKGAYLVFAPIGGAFVRRFGYKNGIHLGLMLYSLGAIFFWPSAKFEKYGGFVGCTFIGCGLSCLEFAANSYISVLGTSQYASMRLNLSQGFQSIASFAENATTLTNVQWVYLAVAAFGLFCHLPEIKKDTVEETLAASGCEVERQGSFWKQYHCIFGFVAQTFYVGAQVSVASFTVNFLSDSRASLLFSFLGVGVLRIVDPALTLSFYGIACSVLCSATGFAHGYGVVTLFLLFFFETTKGLGVHAKCGSGLIVMGVGGGAWYPSAQAAVADRVSTRRSYLVPFAGFFVMTLRGFEWRNVDQLAEAKAVIGALTAEGEKPTTEYKEIA